MGKNEANFFQNLQGCKGNFNRQIKTPASALIQDWQVRVYKHIYSFGKHILVHGPGHVWGSEQDICETPYALGQGGRDVFTGRMFHKAETKLGLGDCVQGDGAER